MRHLPTTHDITASMWGGLPGSAERRTRYSARAAKHRREAQEFRRQQHRKRMRLFAPFALAGAVLLVWQLTQWTPQYWLIGLGMLLVLPALTEALYDAV